MENIIIFAGVLAVIVGIVVQVVKTASPIPNRLMPLVSIVIGVVVSALSLFIPELVGDLSVGGTLLAGFFAGASASGLYDLLTKTPQGFKDVGDDI